MRKLGVTIVALALLAAMPVARADDRVDGTEAVVKHGFAAECRRRGLGTETCAAIDGRTIGPERVDAYERSWVHYALTLQRGLDDNVPLLRGLWPHTHNTFNSSSYAPTLTNQDPNQVYSITDQLRMDIRAIEFDIYPMPGRDDLVLCHAEDVAIGPTHIPVGCTIDAPLRDGLAELNTWLQRPVNRNEVVILYIENGVHDQADAIDQAVADFRASIGDLVYRPADHGAGRCAPMPMSVTRAQMRAAGKRVLLVGNCSPGAWGDWVHQRGPQWVESGSAKGDDYPDFAQCAATRAKVGYATHLVRWFEDRTWVTTMVDGAPGQLTEIEARRMVRCGVNLIGFDQLTPEDPRLAAIVWSWAPGWPRVDGSGGDCVANGGDGRWRTAACGEKRHVACITPAGDRYVSKAAVTWSRLAAACGRAGRPDVPPNGYENELLKAAKAKAGFDVVWLRYRRVRG